MNAFKRLGYFFLPIPFAAVAVAQEKSIRIGYAECVSATNYPKATLEKIGQLKWYFAHASVGANMMDDTPHSTPFFKFPAPNVPKLCPYANSW